jgi:transposase
MKSDEEIMEILEAFDLTASYRASAELAGCDHHTVARYVAERDEGRAGAVRPRRERSADPFADKIEEWVERSRGLIRADSAHRRLLAMGYAGSQRTTRRAVHEAKAAYARGRWRVYRPWVPEPGLWLQWDWATGPEVGGRPTSLFCAWLAWSRYRVVLPSWDRQLPSLVALLDATLRILGGVPTYALTDNEKTVTVTHVARIAVRNPDLVAAARHYGLHVASCTPFDPESKGGAEATVRIAKADLVPTDANLHPGYASFGALEAACHDFCCEVNARPHRVTRRPPAEMLLAERAHLHVVPEQPHTIAFGQTRMVSRESTVSVGGVIYSVPHALIGAEVWVRVAGEELVVVAASGPAGAREVARHALSTPGTPRIADEHYPPRPEGALARTPRAQSAAEAAFLALGPGAERWLVKAAAAGTSRIRTKMAEAVALGALMGNERVEAALVRAAEAERFAEGDLRALLDHHASGDGSARRADERHTLQGGTSAWARVGR